MSFPVPFRIYSNVTGLPIAGVVPTFQQYKRINSDGTVTDLIGSAPAIADKGGGLYLFSIPDSQMTGGSIIEYVIDCGATSADRFLDDSVRSDAAIAPIVSIPSGTTVNFIVKAGDLQPSIETTLTDGRTGISLTGATVQFRLAVFGSNTPVFTKAAVIVDVPTRRVRYDWAAGDTAVAGMYQGEFIVTNGSQAMTYPADGYYNVELSAPL